MRLKQILFCGLMCAAGHVARAEYLFTWEGSSNLFHGSFEVTDAETQPNQFFINLSLTNSVSITSPDGQLFQWNSSPPIGQDVFRANSTSPSFNFGISLYYPQETSQGYLQVLAYSDSIEELQLMPGQNDTILYNEAGSWNITYIPEPSTLSLLVLTCID